MNQPDLAAQVVDLQMRVAHQDDTLLKLDDVIAKQQQSIMQLNKSVRQLANQLQSLRESNPGGGEDERPPHY